MRKEYIGRDGRINATNFDENTFEEDGEIEAKWVDVYEITLNNGGGVEEEGTAKVYLGYGEGIYKEERCETEIEKIEEPTKIGKKFNGYWDKGHRIKYINGKGEMGILLWGRTKFL